MSNGSNLDPSTLSHSDNVYPNAFFDYLTKLLPKKLKVLFVWLEYLYVNSGHIFGALKKFSEYPITEITIETRTEANKELKNKVEHILHNVIKIKKQLICWGLDYNIYGNSFLSLFKPFNRYLVCRHCKAKHNAAKTDYTWNSSTFEFKIVCQSCKKSGIALVEHEKSMDKNKLKVIRWNAKDIDINHNPITEEREYYYTIPQSIITRIKNAKPDKFLLDTLPWEFILTIKANKIFKFSEGAIYHMAMPAPAGINKEWGFPGLLSAMKPFFYTAILRKANEAIALEHIVPMRVLYPQGTSSSNDPTQYISLSRWKDEMEGAIKKWRRDPNHIKFSPIPVGVENLGGDGRAMLTLAEVQAAEENIVTSMGVPKEFVYGGMSDKSGGVTLRMLENMFFTYTDQLKDGMQWITNEICDYLGLERVTTGMVPFKLIDDVQQKQTTIQLGLQTGVISKTSITSLLDHDIDEEREKQLQEAIAEAQQAKKINEEISKIEQSLSQQVKNEQTSNPLNYDPMAVMQVGQQQAMALIQIPMEQRKSMLLQLQAQDPVLHAVVTRALDDMHKMERQQGAGAVAAAGGTNAAAIKPPPVM